MRFIAMNGMQELRGGVQIVVATPGRLLDLVNDGALTLASVDYIVLDEADRMVTTIPPRRGHGT